RGTPRRAGGRRRPRPAPAPQSRSARPGRGRGGILAAVLPNVGGRAGPRRSTGRRRDRPPEDGDGIVWNSQNHLNGSLGGRGRLERSIPETTGRSSTIGRNSLPRPACHPDSIPRTRRLVEVVANARFARVGHVGRGRASRGKDRKEGSGISR